MKAAVLSDTHDLLRQEVLDMLSGCDCILHAGDFASEAVYRKLSSIAPVHGVRGNADAWGTLPLSLSLDLEGIHVVMAHKKKELPDTAGADLVITGHTHRYSEAKSGETTFLNPGSCGPRRLYLPATLALLTVSGRHFEIRRVDIQQAQESAPAQNIYVQVTQVVQETQKGRSVSETARRLHMEDDLVEQIVRLYVTHPGVTVEGILTKMGL